MGLFDAIFGTPAERANKAHKRFEQRLWEFDQALTPYALTCLACDKLGYPLPNTSNRYKCCGCGRQFSGAKHNLTIDYNGLSVNSATVFSESNNQEALQTQYAEFISRKSVR